jgi:hypothetical protein
LNYLGRIWLAKNLMQGGQERSEGYLLPVYPVAVLRWNWLIHRVYEGKGALSLSETIQPYWCFVSSDAVEKGTIHQMVDILPRGRRGKKDLRCTTAIPRLREDRLIKDATFAN